MSLVLDLPLDWPVSPPWYCDVDIHGKTLYIPNAWIDILSFAKLEESL